MSVKKTNTILVLLGKQFWSHGFPEKNCEEPLSLYNILIVSLILLWTHFMLLTSKNEQNLKI